MMENTETLSLNGYSYTKEEVFEALRKKGYLLLKFAYIGTDHAFMGGTEFFGVTTHCAIKAGDIPAEKNIWQNIAIKEFQKEFLKPKLV